MISASSTMVFSTRTPKINFKSTNAINLKEEFDGEYDLILLSNILDYVGRYWGAYWDYATLQEYIKGLEGISKKKAIIFLNYLFVHPKYAVTMFDSSIIKMRDLKREEIYALDDDTSGMILKRVK